MLSKNKHLLVIAGPTAVGKTEICLLLAKKFQTEIISSDSRQFYCETEVGTAKPSIRELEQVPHHFINSLSIFDPYDVRKFELDAISLLDRLFQKHDVVIMTGGSGLYIDAICYGFDEIPDVDPAIRKELILDFEKQGIQILQAKLQKLDPVYFEQVDIHNPQRLMRALEVCLGTGKAYSSFRKKKKNIRTFNCIMIGLERDRKELYQRIDQRMDKMIGEGIFQEAEKLFPHRYLNALQTVGYSEVFGFLEGKYDKEEAIRLLKRNSRRYAKRQMTWFKKSPEMTWFHPGKVEEIICFIEEKTQ
ncbi:tRNA (adenosine(37)-N6)-dimethylallyltransferase MiaA [Aquiflexum sp. TKW24L]|uniref:tRNA (adenosine(37)-N6)-dimethylallyltransferase MiaA n=1 Tax=Aquiflexum sp. TKW24L TaxID=2942212 RepID=UPI0020C067C4|nr:tRNA (adenosine(37)-N6)-dimethylallyltransferase MiaA [Aquiflexum sp. TKW24L]MCL6260968.1 tRNA (adenosine(37)-N6)-dimethylallyltransferase MiaA [Aquiflexum sp. TKW24L]